MMVTCCMTSASGTGGSGGGTGAGIGNDGVGGGSGGGVGGGIGIGGVGGGGSGGGVGGGIGRAADVTGLSRVYSDLLSRLDEFIRRVDLVRDDMAHVCECSELIDKVVVTWC